MTPSLVLFALLAAASPAAVPTGSDLDTVVDRLQKRYESTAGFQADVVQEMKVATLDRTIRTSGRVYFKRPGRMRWELENHKREIIVADGEYLWVYHPDEKQAFKASFSDAFQSTTPISFLTGIGKIRDDFEISSDGREGDLVYLRLKPRLATEVGTLRLGVDPDTYDVLEADIRDPMGNQTSLTFRNIDRESDLAEDLFRFDIPRGTEVLEAPRIQ